MNKRHNKQHDARAASFKRLAKAIRGIAKERGFQRTSFMFDIARAFDAEAKLLMSMR